MKKIYLYTMFAAALLASCSELESNYDSLSDKNIRFTVVSGTESRSLAGNGMHSLQQPLVATTTDGGTLYLHPMVQSIERMEQLQREAAASYTNPKGILKESRATLTTENLTAFNVVATRYAAGTLATTTPNYIYNAVATKNAKGYWETEQQYIWPENDDKLAFFAYAVSDMQHLTMCNYYQKGAPSLSFTMEDEVNPEKDLVTAVAFDCASGAQGRSGVALTFSHVLTNVKFVLASELSGTLKSVFFRGIYYNGEYEFPLTANTAGTWNFHDEEHNYTSVYGVSNNDLTREITFFAIPQTFGDDASVEVVYNDGTRDITLMASLKNQEWTAGSSVIYKISDSEVNTLKIANITFPTLSHPGLPKTAYAYGDKAGLYVVDAQGNIITNNAKLTYNGYEWSTYAVMPFSLEYDYYLYYPYSSAGLANTSNTTSGAKSVSRATTETAGEATSFFAPGIAAWPIVDQSTSNNFIASDLHIAKGKLSSANATNIDFNMTHAMGLAQFELGSKNNLVQENYLSTDANYKWVVGSGGTATATSSFASASLKPYGYATGKYLVWVKPNTATTISSDAGETDTWETSLTFNVAANTISDKQTAYSARSVSSTQYTLQVGDYLYSDGSFAHSNSMPTATAARHPIAVVFSTTTSSTDNAAGYKSGYAIALASAGAQLTWCKDGIGAASARVNSAVISLAEAKADLDGRTKTNVVVSRSDFSKANYPSFYYATHFGTSEIGLTTGTGSSSSEASGGSAGYAAPTGTTVKNSGWYLGSIGQYYLVAKNLGGNIDNPTSTWQDGGDCWYVDGSAQANINALEAIFAKGSSSWAPSFGMPWSSNQYGTAYWTSSEAYYSRAGYVVEWVGRGGFVLNGQILKYSAYTDYRGVRPVIAF